MGKKALIGGGLVLTSIALGGFLTGIAQPPLNVRVDRWLEVKQVKGQVTYNRVTLNRPAKVGDLLTAIGDALITGNQSTALLFVDTGIGVVDVSENTRLIVQELSVAPDNGRITRLQITQGQARLKVRPFTHRGSQLEIRTPASSSGVRGTDFGVAIQPNGKTGLAVLAGGVESRARGQTRSVDGGFQNFTIPGEPPSIPTPLKNNTGLQYVVDRVIEGTSRKFRVRGQVDPVNYVEVNNVPVSTDRAGRFTSDLQEWSTIMAVQVLVRTPLGQEQTHVITIR